MDLTAAQHELLRQLARREVVCRGPEVRSADTLIEKGLARAPDENLNVREITPAGRRFIALGR